MWPTKYDAVPYWNANMWWRARLARSTHADRTLDAIDIIGRPLKMGITNAHSHRARYYKGLCWLKGRNSGVTADDECLVSLVAKVLGPYLAGEALLNLFGGKRSWLPRDTKTIPINGQVAFSNRVRRHVSPTWRKTRAASTTRKSEINDSNVRHFFANTSDTKINQNE